MRNTAFCSVRKAPVMKRVVKITHFYTMNLKGRVYVTRLTVARGKWLHLKLIISIFYWVSIKVSSKNEMNLQKFSQRKGVSLCFPLHCCSANIWSWFIVTSCRWRNFFSTCHYITTAKDGCMEEGDSSYMAVLVALSKLI